MWPWGRKNSELVTISLTPQNLVCSLIGPGRGPTAKSFLKAYVRIPLRRLELAQALLFNQTSIKQHIVDFIRTTGLENPPIALALSGPKILEQVVQIPESSPTDSSFNIPELQMLNWDCAYLCPSQRGGFDFFVCGMKPEHLFSYQLLGHSANINLVTITTQQLTHLHLYKHLQGKAFRQSQLSLDLLQQRYDPHALFDATAIENTLVINPKLGVDLLKEYSFLGTHVGLFLSEQNA